MKCDKPSTCPKHLKFPFVCNSCSRLPKYIDMLKFMNDIFFDCAITDNESKLQQLPLIKANKYGKHFTRVLYCGLYSSWQKGGCEKIHSLFRYFIKKGESLDFMSQDEINTIFSQINSIKRKSLSSISAYTKFKQKFGLTGIDM